MSADNIDNSDDDDYPDKEPPFISPYKDQPPVPHACYMCFTPGPDPTFCWSSDDDGNMAIICMSCVEERRKKRLAPTDSSQPHK